MDQIPAFCEACVLGECSIHSKGSDIELATPERIRRFRYVYTFVAFLVGEADMHFLLCVCVKKREINKNKPLGKNRKHNVLVIQCRSQSAIMQIHCKRPADGNWLMLPTMMMMMFGFLGNANENKLPDALRAARFVSRDA